jgi:hypothetical protein
LGNTQSFSSFTLLLGLDSPTRTAAVIFAESILYRTAVRARFESLTRLPRVVAGAIEVGQTTRKRLSFQTPEIVEGYHFQV